MSSCRWVFPIDGTLPAQKLPFLPENIISHSKKCQFLTAKKLLQSFSQSRQRQMSVLQTAALFSRFVPLIKNVTHQFTSAWSHLADAILLVHIWQDLMETDGTPIQCSKKIFVIYLSKIGVVLNSATCLPLSIFHQVDWKYVSFKLTSGLFLKNVCRQFAMLKQIVFSHS